MLLAKGDVTVHKLLDPTQPRDDPAALGYSSVVLGYGDSLKEAEVPQWVLDKVEAGEGGLLVKATHKEVAEAVKKVQAEIAAAEGNEINASNADDDANQA